MSSVAGEYDFYKINFQTHRRDGTFINYRSSLLTLSAMCVMKMYNVQFSTRLIRARVYMKILRLSHNSRNIGKWMHEASHGCKFSTEIFFLSFANNFNLCFLHWRSLLDENLLNSFQFLCILKIFHIFDFIILFSFIIF